MSVKERVRVLSVIERALYYVLLAAMWTGELFPLFHWNDNDFPAIPAVNQHGASIQEYKYIFVMYIRLYHI